MSENPPKVFAAPARELELPPEPKVIEHALEEAQVLSAEEGGGKVRVERVVECDGSMHAELREEMTYDSSGALINTVELSRKPLGPCTGNHR